MFDTMTNTFKADALGWKNEIYGGNMRGEQCKCFPIPTEYCWKIRKEIETSPVKHYTGL